MPRRHHQDCDLLGANRDSIEEGHFKQNNLVFKGPEVGVEFAFYGKQKEVAWPEPSVCRRGGGWSGRGVICDTGLYLVRIRYLGLL